MDLFNAIEERKLSLAHKSLLRSFRLRADRRLRRIKAIDRQLNLTSMERKYDYIVKNHPDYVRMIDKFISECGSLTMKHGDSGDLDRTKAHLWGNLFLGE